MKLSGNDLIIPAVMFHSVGLQDVDWIYRHLSGPVDLFEAMIAMLVRKGTRFVFWDDLYAHMAGTKKLSGPAIMLTFDDGYLDNWVYAYPILKNHGAKGTIFVNPEFVAPSTEPRPNLDDVNQGRADRKALEPRGFLNWAEMRAMEEEGIMDIQSHALTHTWYFSGPKPLDFHRPGLAQYPWMAWNVRPERKHVYMREDQSSFVPAGTPVYENQKALVCRRYFPPVEVVEGLVAHVEQSGRTAFFQKPDWKRELTGLHEEVMSRHGHKARYESEAEYLMRIRHELSAAKSILEAELGKRIDYLCWPGGGYSDECLKAAKETGYLSTTFSSRDRSDFRNLPGADPSGVKRMGAHAYHRLKAGRRRIRPLEFYCSIERHKGSLFHKWLGRAFRLRALLAGAQEAMN